MKKIVMTFCLAVLAIGVMALPTQAGILDSLQAYWDYDGDGNDSSSKGNDANLTQGAIDYVSEGLISGGQVVQVTEQPSVTSALYGEGFNHDITNEVTWTGWTKIVTNDGAGKGGFGVGNGLGAADANGAGKLHWRYKSPQLAPSVWHFSHVPYNTSLGPAAAYMHRTDTNSEEVQPYDVGVWQFGALRVDTAGNVDFYVGREGQDDLIKVTPTAVIDDYQGLDTTAWDTGVFRTAYYYTRGADVGIVQGDEAAIFSAALSDGDIEAIYDNNLAGNRLDQIPEPATLGLLSVGALLILGRRRRI
jgi:hypothetical protein